MGYEDDLSRVPLFASLSRGELRLLARTVVERKYAKGETIFRDGEHSFAFFVVKTGRVELTRRAGAKSAASSELGAGNVFGETALLGGPLRVMATVKAVEETECLLLPSALLRRLARGSRFDSY